MQASDFDHRCTEPTCCVYGQPTSTSCLCHKSREDMILAALAAEKRAREKAERERDRSRELYQQLQQSIYDYKMETEAAVVEAETAETHSAALARALEEARDELLECKADYHRNPSSVIDKCNAVLAEARSPLAPKEDTNA